MGDVILAVKIWFLKKYNYIINRFIFLQNTMEVYWSWEYIKLLKDEASSWVTYIWWANFDWDKAYRTTTDTAKPIWRIRKIVVDWNITEFFYPDWDTSFSFSWDNRASLNYI